MRVLYSRVSTQDQNPERQLKDKNYDYVFTDYCSGVIDLYSRPKGQQVKKLLDEGNLSELHIHSIDRLGRDLISTLSVWNELTLKGVVIVCKTLTLGT